MYCHFVKMLIWFLPCFTHKFHDWSTVLDLFFASDKGLLSRWLEHTSGQIIANSAEVTPNGGVVRESSQNPLNSGLGIIVICPDTSIAWELPLPIWRDFPVLNLYYIDDISLYIYISYLNVLQYLSYIILHSEKYTTICFNTSCIANQSHACISPIGRPWRTSFSTLALSIRVSIHLITWPTWWN